jgi:type I restriction enzyme R subunit
MNSRELLRKDKYTNLMQLTEIKPELKVGLILVLAKHGYLLVDRDEVYKEMFEQAENFGRYRRSRVCKRAPF